MIKMNKARIGVIGAGWWATEYHIPNLKKREDVELVSVCKLEEDQLNFVKNKFNFLLLSIYGMVNKMILHCYNIIIRFIFIEIRDIMI